MTIFIIICIALLNVIGVLLVCGGNDFHEAEEEYFNQQYIRQRREREFQEKQKRLNQNNMNRAIIIDNVLHKWEDSNTKEFCEECSLSEQCDIDNIFCQGFCSDSEEKKCFHKVGKIISLKTEEP